jgi:hypothetical protein
MDPKTLGAILMGTSLLVSGMLIHYVVRVGRRHDPLCIMGLLAASFGLQQSARALDAPGNMFSVIGLGFALLCIAFAVSAEGLRRFRNGA